MRLRGLYSITPIQMRTRVEGVNKAKNFADIIYGSSLTAGTAPQRNSIVGSGTSRLMTRTWPRCRTWMWGGVTSFGPRHRPTRWDTFTSPVLGSVFNNFPSLDRTTPSKIGCLMGTRPRSLERGRLPGPNNAAWECKPESCRMHREFQCFAVSVTLKSDLGTPHLCVD